MWAGQAGDFCSADACTATPLPQPDAVTLVTHPKPLSGREKHERKTGIAVALTAIPRRSPLNVSYVQRHL